MRQSQVAVCGRVRRCAAEPGGVVRQNQVALVLDAVFSSEVWCEVSE